MMRSFSPMSDVEELAHAIAGAGGGALSMIVTYPLVTLSTLAQTKKSSTNSPKKSALDAANAIVSEKGILGLYAGLELALYGITLTNFVYYYFYELASNVFLRANALRGRKSGLLAIQLIITGAIAGAITCVALNPFWVANTRTMTAKKELDKDGKTTKSTSTFKTLVDIAQNDGISTLFAGVFPALVLVINPIIQYTIFEQIKNLVVAAKGKNSFTAGKAFFIGAFGKLIATFLTYPYITLKSRMHIKRKKVEQLDKPVKLLMVQEIQKILKEEGLDGLYGGLTVKLMQSISTAAFLFYFKETLLTGSVKLVEVLRLLKMKKASV